MFVTKKAIPRRAVLRGIGVSLALPLLDSMVPALTAARAISAPRVCRLGIVYVPNGIRMRDWTPTTQGAVSSLPPILEPLRPFRDQLVVLSGLSTNGLPRNVAVHASASTKFLTDTNPKSEQGSALHAGISIDQLVAKEIGRDSLMPSLELTLENNELAGSCDAGYSCTYQNTLCWRSPTLPVPMEIDPRAVFERLFGDADLRDPEERRARRQSDRSLLDSVTRTIGSFQRGLGASDRVALSEYVDSIRDVERAIQASERRANSEPTLERPSGIPSTFEEHVRLMSDLLLLAYQSDSTRVCTFMLGREASSRTYPQIGVPDPHHATSHHQNDPVKLANLSKINTHHVRQLAYLLDRLESTRDGDGSLLDHSMILYGSGMSDGNAHAHYDLPILLAGGAAGRLKGGRHLRYADETPLANLHVAMLDKLGVSMDTIGNSSGLLDLG